MSNNERRKFKLPVQVPVVVVLLLLAVWAILRWQDDTRGDPAHLVVSGSVGSEAVEVASKISGRLAKVLVAEGDSLQAGQLIAELDVPELLAQHSQLEGLKGEAQAFAAKLAHGARPQEIDQARARVAAAQAQLSELELGTREEDIAAAEAAWQAAEVQYTLAVEDLERVRQLYEAAVVPRSQLDAAQARADSQRQQADIAKQQYDKAVAGPRSTTIDAARAQLQQAQSALDLLLAGSRPEDIAAANARIASIAAQIEGLEVSLAEAMVRAPDAGNVLIVSHQPGELLAPGTSICTLLLTSANYVQVFIPEEKLSWALPGAKAVLTVDAYPADSFQGVVTYLAAEGEFTPRNLQTKEKRVEQVFRCKVRVDDTSGRLRPGMVCDVTFGRPAGVAASER